MKKNIVYLVGCIVCIGITYLVLQNNYKNKLGILTTELSADKVSTKRQELLEAWKASQKFTLKIVNQMPDEYFEFQYTPEAMTFAEQWRHCAIFTCSQLAGRFNLEGNPYKDKSKLPPVELNKEEVIAELNRMYDYVFKVIENLPEKELYEPIDFAGDTITGWRLIYAMENHIIHHRGSCVVYLRLKGVIPIGYVGW
ncbi:MAG: DinB family protein [Cyclobacteriaceae bacterium]|nr:DinB family protein [Cyclobacteriaceae bacterium]